MCGISGIISKRDQAIEPACIERMTDLVAHRGPDGKGYYFGNNFALGHRRLSILDLSDHGHQPMVYEERYWITFNGEIYNYLEIRSGLETLGYTFRSGTDTEVILAAYAHWGAGCCSRFNGMWAFAIYDSLDQKIFFARDRFGVKPLYYIDTGDRDAERSGWRRSPARIRAVFRRISQIGVDCEVHTRSPQTGAALQAQPEGRGPLQPLLHESRAPHQETQASGASSSPR